MKNRISGYMVMIIDKRDAVFDSDALGSLESPVALFLFLEKMPGCQDLPNGKVKVIRGRCAGKSV